MKTKFVLSILAVLIAFAGFTQTTEGDQVKLDDSNRIAFVAFHQPQTVAIANLQAIHDTQAEFTVQKDPQVFPQNPDGSEFQLAPSCPSYASGQYTVTNQDGSAVSYCVYQIPSGFMPVATYTLACAYCVWQNVQ